MWCTLTVGVYIDPQQFEFDGAGIAKALLRNVTGIKVIDGIALHKIAKEEVLWRH